MQRGFLFWWNNTSYDVLLQCTGVWRAWFITWDSYMNKLCIITVSCFWDLYYLILHIVNEFGWTSGSFLFVHTQIYMGIYMYVYVPIYIQIQCLVFCLCRLIQLFLNQKLDININIWLEKMEDVLFFPYSTSERNIYVWNFFCLEVTWPGDPDRCLLHWKSSFSDNNVTH